MPAWSRATCLPTCDRCDCHYRLLAAAEAERSIFRTRCSGWDWMFGMSNLVRMRIKSSTMVSYIRKPHL